MKSGTKGKKSEGKAPAVDDAATAEVTPVGSPEPPAGVSQRKSVRFSLKRNLINTIGQAPFAAEIRTPPTSKPKGPALKRVSGVADSAPGRLQSHKQKRKAAAAEAAAAAGTRSAGKSRGERSAAAARSLPSPKSIPRPRAAEFF